MSHPEGGQGTYFKPVHTFNQAYEYIGDGHVSFTSTTGERINARRGKARDGITLTIVFEGENNIHVNVCYACWGYRINCYRARIGQCAEALDRDMSLQIANPDHGLQKSRIANISTGETMMDYRKFPDYYRNYSWSKKHKLFGYPPDAFPEFRWISSLENRFAWVVLNFSENNSASKYLIQEMIEWGGSQNGIFQKFNDGCGEVNLFMLVKDVINNLSDPKRAISSALLLPGLCLAYASKLLRFMKPEMYGALDSKIRKALKRDGRLPNIFDGVQNSMISGYVNFVVLLQEIKDGLKREGIKKPACHLSNDGTWRASEIEMALFSWASLVEPHE
jgi:hypothetical protein